MLRVYKLISACFVLGMLWYVVAPRRGASFQAFVRPAGAPPGPVKILQFYASSGLLVTGQKAQLCYGVQNAKSVRIAPLGTDVVPAARRCLEIVPQHTTHYTILAEGYDGKVAMQSLTLAVQAPAAPPGPLVNWAGLRISEQHQPYPEPQELEERHS
jgi:hypothetical protein